MENDGRRILVVDDSEEFLLLITTLLKFHNINVEGVESPIEALEKYKNEDYDLVITDYMMEEMNGIELAEKMLGHKEIKIILITAKNLNETELDKVSSNNLVYVNKPIMPNELYSRILDTLES